MTEHCRSAACTQEVSCYPSDKQGQQVLCICWAAPARDWWRSFGALYRSDKEERRAVNCIFSAHGSDEHRSYRIHITASRAGWFNSLDWEIHAAGERDGIHWPRDCGIEVRAASLPRACCHQQMTSSALASSCLKWLWQYLSGINRVLERWWYHRQQWNLHQAGPCGKLLVFLPCLTCPL